MLRIRQLAIAAAQLAPTLDSMQRSLALQVSFNDPGVATFGLENAVLPAGEDFLEIVAPVEPNTTAGRWIERMGGDAGYMVILQTDDFAEARARIQSTGTRIVWDIDRPEAKALHLHPRDVGAAILSFDAMDQWNSWLWAGPDWRAAVSTDICAGFAAACIASPDPEALGQRWARLCGRELELDGAHLRIPLDGNELRFEAGTTEALVGVDFRCNDVDRFHAAARDAGSLTDSGDAWIGGVRFRPV